MDLNELRRITEAADPKTPWYSSGEFVALTGNPDTGLDADFIAATSPTVVLELLDRLERAEAVIEKVRQDALTIRDAVDEWEASGDDEKLVNEYIDPWITRTMKPETKEEA